MPSTCEQSYRVGQAGVGPVQTHQDRSGAAGRAHGEARNPALNSLLRRRWRLETLNWNQEPTPEEAADGLREARRLGPEAHLTRRMGSGVNGDRYPSPALGWNS